MGESLKIYDFIVNNWTPHDLFSQVEALVDQRHFISLYGWNLFDKIVCLSEEYDLADINKSLDVIINNSKGKELYLMTLEKLSDPSFSFQGYKGQYILLRTLKYGLLELNDDKAYNTSLSLLLKKILYICEHQDESTNLSENVNEVLIFIEELIQSINHKHQTPIYNSKYDLFIGFLLHIASNLVFKLGDMSSTLDRIIKMLLSMIRLDQLLLYSYETRYKIYEYKKWRCRYEIKLSGDTGIFDKMNNIRVSEYIDDYFTRNDHLIPYASVIPWQVVSDELILEINNKYNELIENNTNNNINIKSKQLVEFERFHKQNNSAIFWSIDGLSLISSRILHNTCCNWSTSQSSSQSLEMSYSIKWLTILFYPYLNILLRNINIANEEGLNYFIDFIHLNTLSQGIPNMMQLFVPEILLNNSIDDILSARSAQFSKKSMHSSIVYGLSYDSNSMIQVITGAIMSCSNDMLQKKGFYAFKRFINTHDEHSRFSILYHISKECPYNHMKGLILDVVKDNIIGAMRNNTSINSMNNSNVVVGKNKVLLPTDYWNNCDNNTEIYSWRGHSLFWSPHVYTFFIKDVTTTFMSLNSNHMLDYQQVLIPCANIAKLLLIILKNKNNAPDIKMISNFFTNKNIMWCTNKMVHKTLSSDNYNSICDIFVKDLENCVNKVTAQLESLRQCIHDNTISLNDPSDLAQLELCIFILSDA